MSGATYTITAPVDVALPPPPGAIPDFQDPFTLRPYHNIAASLSLTFASIFLILRMYTKIRLVKECRWEDCKPLRLNTSLMTANAGQIRASWVTYVVPRSLKRARSDPYKAWLHRLHHQRILCDQCERRYTPMERYDRPAGRPVSCTNLHSLTLL